MKISLVTTRLILTVLMSIASTGCATGSTSPGVLTELWYYAHSQPVQFKGGIDSISFELNARTETASGTVVMSTLVKGEQTYDYVVEVSTSAKGDVDQCVVTRAPSGSMSNYFGTLIDIQNSIQPKDATSFSCVANYVDRKLHQMQLGDARGSVLFRMQLTR